MSEAKEIQTMSFLVVAIGVVGAMSGFFFLLGVLGGVSMAITDTRTSGH